MLLLKFIVNGVRFCFSTELILNLETCDFNKMVLYEIVQLLNENFNGQIISRNGDIFWSLRPWDWTPTDYFSFL